MVVDGGPDTDDVDLDDVAAQFGLDVDTLCAGALRLKAAATVTTSVRCLTPWFGGRNTSAVRTRSRTRSSKVRACGGAPTSSANRSSPSTGDADLLEFVRMLALNWVIVGTDAHAKNYALPHAPRK